MSTQLAQARGRTGTRRGGRAAPPRRGVIRVGTASWSDPGFIADWYPAGLPARERLPWYAEHFNLVEVNSSFYAVPGAKTVARWCDQTPADFVFDVKLHRLLSRHSTSVKFLPSNLRKWARVHKDKVELTPDLEAALVERFLEGIQPLQEAGKLGALLLQLSPAFSPREYSLSELDDLIEMLHGYRLALELRHREWLTGERLAATVAYFKKRRVALVSVDAPRREHFMVLPPVDVATDPNLAYLRAHGRNAHGFIAGRSVAERFDYDYSTKELREIAGRAEQLAEVVRDTHVIFNNNKSNYAPRAAARFRKIVEQAGAPTTARA
jgi:uncharacterized protein YecE (DUF72 family)